MKEETHDIDHLIAGWLANSLSDSEQEKFQQVLKDHPEKAEEVEQLHEIWDLTNSITVPRGQSFESRWEKLSPIAKSRRITPLFKWAAAAVVIICAAVPWLMSFKSLSVAARSGEIKKTDLPDGSHVTINAVSAIEYNSSWFSPRTVKLQGEAFFNVAKNGSPFIVYAGEAKILVTGTSFNIRQWQNEVIVSCLTGKVKVSRADNSERSVQLDKGMRCYVTTGNITASRFDLQNNAATAWTEGKLYFDKTPLSQVFEELRRFYNVEINYNRISGNTFTGTFENTTIEDAIQIICLSAGLRYSGRKETGFSILLQ